MWHTRPSRTARPRTGPVAQTCMRTAPKSAMGGCVVPARAGVGPGGRADVGNGLLIRFTQVRILPGARIARGRDRRYWGPKFPTPTPAARGHFASRNFPPLDPSLTGEVRNRDCRTPASDERPTFESLSAHYLDVGERGTRTRTGRNPDTRRGTAQAGRARAHRNGAREGAGRGGSPAARFSSMPCPRTGASDAPHSQAVQRLEAV